MTIIRVRNSHLRTCPIVVIMEKISREDHVRTVSKVTCYTYLLIVCGLSLLFLLALFDNVSLLHPPVFKIDLLSPLTVHNNLFSNQLQNGTGSFKKVVPSPETGSMEKVVPKPNSENSYFAFIGSEWNEEILPKYVDPKKYFIYRCPCHGLCGGFADREKGMVAAYIMSLLSNRSFGIDHKCPGDLSKYLKPNKVNWNINQSQLKGLRSRSYFAIDNWGFLGKAKTLNFKDYFKEDVIYWTGNQNYVESLRLHKEVPKLVPWLQNMSTCDVYRNVFNVLFAPTENFQKQITKFTNKIGNAPLLCAQMRLGKNPSMPSDAVQGRFLQKRDLQGVWKFFNSSVNVNSKLFIASDSSGIKNKAAVRFPDQFVDTPGPILHVDRMGGFRGKRDDGFMKVVLEQLILSQCNTLLISRSGYSIIGAFLRKDSRNLYMIAGGNVTACTREELLKYYSM